LLALCAVNDSQFGSTYAGLIPLAALKQLLPISSALMDRIHGYLNQDPEEIEKMRVAGRLAADVLEMIELFVKPGVSTGELDRICNDYIVNEQQAISACLATTAIRSPCISINEVVCHGIPDDAKLLKDGDIVNIDVTVIKDEYHGDTSKMFIVGKPTILGERLCRVTQESLYLALRMVKPGIRLRTLGAAPEIRGR
jgi:methionyl aminopeptidase